MSIQEYAALARRLDAVLRDEAARTVTERREAESGRVALDRLVDRLTEQQANLQQAARQLRARMPLIDPPPSGARTAKDALAAAAAAADASDQHRESALERARTPQWLPTWSPVARNAAVYGMCAGAALVFQSGLILLSGRIDPTTATLWSLCGLPSMAFFVAYLLIGVVSLPRIASEDAPPRDRKGRWMTATADRHPRLGAAICFLTLPVVWLVTTLLSNL